MTSAITFLADAPKLAEPVASGSQLILAFLAGIAVIVVLITVVKLHPFLGLIFGGTDGGPGRGREPDQGAQVLHRRLRFDGSGRRHPHRPGRDVRQTAGRLRRCRRDRRHHRRSRVAAGAAMGDGPGGRDHRPADVLRDRPGAADAGDLPGGPALATVVDHRRNPGAGRPVRDARFRAAAPRTADRGRPAQRRPRPHAGARRGGRHSDDHRRGPAVREAGRQVGGRRGAGHLRRRPVRRRRPNIDARHSASRCSRCCCPSC